jgi:hypothetical protein
VRKPKFTAEQLTYDAAWKMLYRAIVYIVRTRQNPRDPAAMLLSDAITEVRREMGELTCAS